jgi:hypothetical protein
MIRGGGTVAVSAAVVVVISVVSVVAAVRLLWPKAAAEAPAPARQRRHSMIRPERRGRERHSPSRQRPAELQIMGQDFLDIPEVADISDSGIAIRVPHKFNGHKPTKEVDLLLTLHGQGTVRAKGAIRHVSYTRNDTATFGVELVAIDDEDRGKIRRYVAELEQAVPEPTQDEPALAAMPPLVPERSRK